MPRPRLKRLPGYYQSRLAAGVLLADRGLQLLPQLLKEVYTGVWFLTSPPLCIAGMQEQKLQPGEKIDMPVFFYVDPEFATDVRLSNITNLTLSYTFFKVHLPHAYEHACSCLALINVALPFAGHCSQLAVNWELQRSERKVGRGALDPLACLLKTLQHWEFAQVLFT